MLPDSSDIDAAVIVALQNDAQLASYAPNGVYMDEAPPGSTAFVIVSIIDALDVGEFGQRSQEDILYMIEFRERKPTTGAGNAKAAAQRIQAVLEDQPLTIAGYTWMTVHRETRERKTEVDEVDPSIRWNRRGGQYRVQVSLNPFTRT